MKLKNVLLLTAILAAKSLQLAHATDGGFIVGGAPVPPVSAIAHGTVALVIGPALCTGSIVAQDLVVTAAHCLEGHPASVRIIFSTALTPDTFQHNSLGAQSYIIHPAYRMDQTAPDQNDIALIRFQGGLPASYGPNHVLADDRLLTRGKNVILAGYGITDAQSHAGAGTLRSVQVQIADENFGKTEVLLDQTEDRGACHGDSGGPAFIEQQDGTLLLWGVTSRGYPLHAPDDCMHKSVYTKISDQMDFLRAAAQKLRQS